MEKEAQACRYADQLAAQLHRRMAAIQVEAAIATSEQELLPRKPATKQSKMVTLETASGHHMQRSHRNHQWQCTRCGRGPKRGSLADWLRFSRCHSRRLGNHPLVEGDLVSLDLSTAREVPTEACHQNQREQQLLLAVRKQFGPTARTHHTHYLHKTGAVYWCGRCGGYAETLLCSLSQPCHPPTKKGTCNLGRLAKGRHPRTGQPILCGGEQDIELELPTPPPPPPPAEEAGTDRNTRKRGGRRRRT